MVTLDGKIDFSVQLIFSKTTTDPLVSEKVFMRDCCLLKILNKVFVRMIHVASYGRKAVMHTLVHTCMGVVMQI